MSFFEKFIDLIVVLVGTGCGWFLSRYFYEQFKQCKFDCKFKVISQSVNLGDIEASKLKITIKNISNVDCLDGKLTVIFKNRFSEIIIDNIQINKYQTKIYFDTLLNKKDTMLLKAFDNIDYFKIEYITQYGFSKIYTKEYNVSKIKKG